MCFGVGRVGAHYALCPTEVFSKAALAAEGLDMVIRLKTLLEEAGLEEAGLEEAGLEEAGLEETGG